MKILLIITLAIFTIFAAPYIRTLWLLYRLKKVAKRLKKVKEAEEVGDLLDGFASAATKQVIDEFFNGKRH